MFFLQFYGMFNTDTASESTFFLITKKIVTNGIKLISFDKINFYNTDGFSPQFYGMFNQACNKFVS